MSNGTDGASAGPVERLAPDPASPWWGEHCARYRFAEQNVVGKRTLDIACGTGYGAALLASAGGSMVIGCDVAVEGVLYGQRSYMSDNLTFAVGDGTSLPFVDDAFDVVVTFETLEHIPDDRGFLSELHRVMRPGGEIILSTPNASVTSSYPRNPFHVREYTLAELQDLLDSDFCSLEFFAQAPSDRYAVSPFLPGHDAASGVGQSLQLIAWKVLRRLPHRWADALARGLLRRRLYPGESDFAFKPDSDSGHVIVARGIAR